MKLGVSQGFARTRRSTVSSGIPAPVAGALLAIGSMLTCAVACATPSAAQARVMSVSESAHLHLTSKHGFTLNEEGATGGTIKGTIYIHLHIANNQGGVTAEVNIYPHGGSLAGEGSASYRVEGAQATFSGRLSITRGTGSYAHAHGSNLRFTGTIERRNDAVAVQLSGQLSV